MQKKYGSDILLGERYIDKQTGFEGTATAITFFQYACERVCLENYDPQRKEVKESIFDAPRLTSLKTGKTAVVEKTGGPGMPNAQRGSLSR